MPFLTDLVTRHEGSHYILTEPLAYQTRYKGEHCSVTVPEDFRTDLASIPRIFRPIYTGHDKTRKPAVLHDYLRAKADVTDKLADRLFLIAMKDEGVSMWKRRTMFWAVRIGSWVT